jgi:hypothetical protein
MYTSANNYGGRQASRTSVNKTFHSNNGSSLWKRVSSTISPVNISNLLIDGTIYYRALNALSDRNAKTNIEPITDTGLMALKPVSFSYIHDNEQKSHFGLIAQDVELIYPNLISFIPGKEQWKSVNYMELIPLLVYHIQCLQRQVEQLSSK